jgi:hypothetical protein
LKLLIDWKMHNVFHVSLLRKNESDRSHVLIEPSNAAFQDELLV